MSSVVTILFSDIVPLQERGVWQGYINIVYAAGVSIWTLYAVLELTKSVID